jgi:hypothetical protein
MTRKWTFFSLILAVVTVFAVSGFPKDTVVASQWAAGPVKIDGLDQDWQDATFLTDPGSKARFAVKNDGKNLYIIFLFKDPMSPSTIEFTGMKVFLNAEGKKSKDFGVHFTKKEVTAEALISSLEKTGEALTDEKRAELRKQGVFHMFEADVINAKKAAAPADPTVKTDPPAYRSARNQRVLCWELRIPLSRTNQPGGLGSEPGKTVKLGFEWGGMTSQVMKEMMAGMSSRGGMSRQGAGVTGSVGTPRDETARDASTGIESNFEYQRDPRTRLHSFWIDLKLAAR